MLCLVRQMNPVRFDGDGSVNMGAKLLLCQAAVPVVISARL